MRELLTGLIVLMSLMSVDCKPAHLERTDTGPDQWETRDFREEGIRLSCPVGAAVDHDASFGVALSLHPVVGPPILDDYPYFTTIRMEVMNHEALQEKIREEESARKRMTGQEWQLWSIREHPSIDRDDGDQYSNYRLDRPCADGNVIRMKAEVRHIRAAGVRPYAEEDDEIVRRILGSAECIEKSDGNRGHARTSAGQ